MMRESSTVNTGARFASSAPGSPGALPAVNIWPRITLLRKTMPRRPAAKRTPVLPQFTTRLSMTWLLSPASKVQSPP